MNGIIPYMLDYWAIHLFISFYSMEQDAFYD